MPAVNFRLSTQIIKITIHCRKNYIHVAYSSNFYHMIFYFSFLNVTSNSGYQEIMDLSLK